MTITGGIAGHSPVTNAMLHFKEAEPGYERYFLRLDLREAYANVNPREVAVDLAAMLGLCSWPKMWMKTVRRMFLAPHGRGLAFGAPSSPVLFNLYHRELDADLSYLGLAHDLTITRYYDDLWFSSPLPVTRPLRREITQIVTDQAGRRNRIHPMKAKLYTHPDQDVVITGVMLRRGGTIGLPQKELKRLEGLLHRAQAVGDISREQVAGTMSFFRQVWRAARVLDRPPTKLELDIYRNYQRYRWKCRRESRIPTPPPSNARGQFEFSF